MQRRKIINVHMDLNQLESSTFPDTVCPWQLLTCCTAYNHLTDEPKTMSWEFS